MLGSSTAFARRLLAWYDRSRRDLPWRVCAPGSAAPDPYHVLVSEAMLQQTQVATVVPYFRRFISRFASLAELAAADEQEVLRLWQGLGYYSRARNLRAAARKVTSEFAGNLPETVEQLLQLPGVGRYTAGAVASIAFGVRSPVLDGNVQRVLCRLDRIESDPRDNPTRDQLWRRAEEILPVTRVGDFNSALMELGATVCTPRSPRCQLCPVSRHCAARDAGIAQMIPPPRRVKTTPLFHRHVFCICRNGRWLIEQRPARGRWAGMWQFVTRDIPADNVPLDLTTLPVPVRSAERIGTVTHALTHRRYHFAVYRCEAIDPHRRRLPEYRERESAFRPSGSRATADTHESPTRRWTSLKGLDKYPLPRPHVKIAEMLAAARGLDSKERRIP